ncbi:Catalase-peroxidase [Clarias magur]|uniref:Catalase-peroxidase n=1 Tax=Clarias magur TaxID=1594786 RepID=A0A8J4XHJ1_CLAMG|nr:Catalase-peroxidase [Clarias magur]
MTATVGLSCLEVCISHIGTLPAANGADPQTTAPELASASLGARWANQPGTGRGRNGRRCVQLSDTVTSFMRFRGRHMQAFISPDAMIEGDTPNSVAAAQLLCLS